MDEPQRDPLHRADKIPKSSYDIRSFSRTNSNIAAIDFGTTFCSLAYCIDNGDTTMLTFDGDCHQRVPNAVLLVKREENVCEVVEFGYRAHEVYTKMRTTERSKYIYFTRMKPLLWNDEELHRETTLESFSKNKFYLIEVIAFILCHLKQRLEACIRQTPRQDLKAVDFDWVITVPAIWKARGKRMMREAAYMGGLLTDHLSINRFTKIGEQLKRPIEDINISLSLALEPESAAIYCQHGSIFSNNESKCLVVDIGGGTIDITAHCISEGKVDVLVTPLGNQCGGVCVNEEFAKFFSEIVDDVNFDSFLNYQDLDKATSHVTSLNTLIFFNFEHQKIDFGQKVTDNNSYKDISGFDKEVVISLPKALVKHYGEDRIRVGTDPLPGIHYDDDKLYITYYQMANIFQPTIDKLLQCILLALDKLKESNISTIYLVGGFGGSRYVHYKVQECITNSLPNMQFHILIPKSPDLAIAIGAVLWRKHRNVVRSRRSDATYGIGVTIPFNETKHDAFYKIVHPETGEARCQNVFSVFVQVGEILSCDTVLETYVIPHRSFHDSLTLTIYCTKELGIQYTKDKNGRLTVRKIGELEVIIPNPEKFPRDERKVNIMLDFSGTEIQAKAIYSVTGEEFVTVCDFLTTLSFI